MSGRADLTDGDIKIHFDNVKNGKLSWFIIGHVPKSDTKFKVTHSGNGDIDELKGELNDGKVQFAVIAVNLGGIRKFVFISWCGEGVAGMKKGFFNGQSQDVANHFKGTHVQINARNEDDLSGNDVLSRVQKATGASFYKQHASQDVENKPEASSIKYEKRDDNQSTENAPVQSSIKYEKRNDNQSTENNPAQSSIRYEKRNDNQSTENAPAQSAIKYEKRNENQSTESNPVQSRRPAPPTSAPPPSRPTPPQTSAPPPVVPKPAPPPVVEEQQTQEETYEETQEEEYQETNEEEYAEETYAEEEYAEEEQQTTGGTQARALYDYQGEKDGDLSFNEGETIQILDKSDPSGWWEGELNGVRGYFPSNFVEEF